MNFDMTDLPLPNSSKKSSDYYGSGNGIVIHTLNKCYGNYTATGTGCEEIFKMNKDLLDYGFHYGIDQDSIARYGIYRNDSPYYPIIMSKVKSIKGNPTYISNALFKKPEENCISICLFINPMQDYEITEKFFIRFVVRIMRRFSLKSKDVWRGFDLSKDDYGPLHLLDESIFKKYLEMIDKYMAVTERYLAVEKQDIIDDGVEFISPFEEIATSKLLSINDYVNRIYTRHKDNPASYANNFKVYDKDLDEIKNYVQNPSTATISVSEYPTGNKLQYKITQKPTGSSCSCAKATDKLDGIEIIKDTMVEPIYPDLITPPGGNIHIANGTSETSMQSSSDTPLSIEEFEKRQKTFSMDNFTDVSKTTIGRPVNCDDEFPVDAQIKKLEEHFPKVKVDKVIFDYTEDNHLGSELGQALAKNYNMAYDMVSEISKRTEQRLVKIENNLSTVMRNLFRLGSRISINCVYYGGQSVYGKYKCVRCLQDDRINDGAIVQLDQCLCCTRYEPVEGQVYAILDESGTNVTQVVDDMQMAYMSLDQYKTHNDIGDMYNPMNFANLKQDASESPLPFSEDKWKDTEEEMINKDYEYTPIAVNYGSGSGGISYYGVELLKEEESVTAEDYKNGFVMDWNPALLETQLPSINKYEIEFKSLNKNEVNLEDKSLDRDLFIDTRQNAVEYESLEFNVKDYVLSGFSSSSSNSSSGVFGVGSAVVRKKIVDYALNAVNLCEEGKAKYSQDNRLNHGDKAIDGIQYWDCSSLVMSAYESAGITGIGTSTHSQYPYCLESSGGLLIPIANVSEALPGDMVWFKTPPNPTDVAGLQNVPYSNGSIVHHIAIYIGDNKYAHASNPNTYPNIKVSTLGNYDHEMCFGRVKQLIELDKQVGTSGEQWSREYHEIPDELWNAASVAESNVAGFIENEAKYGFREVLKEVCATYKYDPYYIAAIMAIETNGNPLCGGNYPGILQSTSGYPTATLEGIKDNIEKAIRTGDNNAPVSYARETLLNNGWVEHNMHVMATAHNCGVFGCLDAMGTTKNITGVGYEPSNKLDIKTVKIPALASNAAEYAEYQGWNSEEKRTYGTKVLRAYNLLYDAKALEEVYRGPR